MAQPRHVLRKTDIALKAFFVAANIEGLTDANIVRTKESAGKTLPVLICNSENALRKRAFNWEVTGSLLLKTDPTDEENNSALEASDTLEDAVIAKMEALVPADDRPQPLANAITAAAVASGQVVGTEFAISAFTINRVSAGFDEDEIWTFAVDFTATVIA